MTHKYLYFLGLFFCFHVYSLSFTSFFSFRMCFCHLSLFFVSSSLLRGVTGGQEEKGVTWKVSIRPHFSWSLTEQKGAEGEKASTRGRRRGVASALGSCSSSLFHWLFFRSCVTILMNQFLFLT